MFPVNKKGKVGFIDRSGKLVIGYDFEEASAFSEGIARVFHNDKVGCIDTKGQLVIPIQFEDMREFSEGLAVVGVKGKYGYINKDGQMVIPAAFYEADSFQNGLAKIRNDMMSAGSFINKDGKIILSERMGLTSKYNEGLIKCKENEWWVYMNIAGEIVIEPKFMYAHPFFEGKAAVQVLTSVSKGDLKESYGFINKLGEMVIPPQFDGADLKFSENRCAVTNGKVGYIDPTGERVIPYQFYLAEHFSEGLALFQSREDGKYGFINCQGFIAIPPKFDDAESFENGLATVGLEKKSGGWSWGYVNKSGDYVWEPS